ncbi:MAG: hypothetical protein ACREXP_30310, partial [Steroidobacteraceae bacterium]
MRRKPGDGGVKRREADALVLMDKMIARGEGPGPLEDLAKGWRGVFPGPQPHAADLAFLDFEHRAGPVEQ